MCLSGLMVKTPERKTEDLRFKSRLRTQIFLSIFINNNFRSISYTFVSCILYYIRAGGGGDWFPSSLRH